MGQILPALTSVKIYGRSSPSHTYQVSGRCSTVRGYPLPATEDPPKVYPRTSLPLGIPGDSGAWVVDRPQGRLCGHVLAWSGRKKVAYICPMEVLLLDIAETLDARDVRLPGGKAIINFTGHETAEVSDLDDYSEQGSIAEEEEEDVPPLHDIRKSGAGSQIGSAGEPKASRRLSTVKREQLYGHHGEGSNAIDANMDKMHI